jgi:methylmalonyl-CoA/ethylmalonyl-CoA epimerase
MPSVKSVHHIAVVVSDIESSLSFWRDGLGLEPREVRDVAAEQSQVAFLPLGSSEIELVRPTTPDSGIARYLAKRGPGMHHVCLEVDDIDALLVHLRNQGIRLIGESPRRAEDGRRYLFVHPESTGGVLVELYEG